MYAMLQQGGAFHFTNELLVLLNLGLGALISIFFFDVTLISI
jgi:hypothetical protein